MIGVAGLSSHFPDGRTLCSNQAKYSRDPAATRITTNSGTS
jgi:hypothetical protein